MATVNEKMTELANAIRSKTGGTSALTLDGMITAVNGITTGSGGTTTYTLWGDHSLYPNTIDVGHLAGSYQVPAGINAYFYDGNDSQRWVYDNIETIQVYSDGSIDIRSTNYDTCNSYLSAVESWVDENEVYINDARLRVLKIPLPVSVSEQLYQLLSHIIDNGCFDVTAYDLGYEVGASQSSGDLEALGALCDWNVVVDSNSSPVITIYNLHPSYTLLCEIEAIDGAGDVYNYEISVAPDDSISWSLWEEEGVSGSGMGTTVSSVRWVA